MTLLFCSHWHLSKYPFHSLFTQGLPARTGNAMIGTYLPTMAERQQLQRRHGEQTHYSKGAQMLWVLNNECLPATHIDRKDKTTSMLIWGYFDYIPIFFVPNFTAVYIICQIFNFTSFICMRKQGAEISIWVELLCWCHSKLAHICTQPAPTATCLSKSTNDVYMAVELPSIRRWYIRQQVVFSYYNSGPIRLDH